MRTQEEILEKVRTTLVELFEIEPSKIELGANLYEDLDIDSIDAIDLMLQLKSYTGRKIEPDRFKHVRTVKDLVDAIQGLFADAPAA